MPPPWWRRLQHALLDNLPASEADLPNTGVATALEHALSSPFVRMPERGYGTRSSSVLQVRRQGHTTVAELDEWQHDPGVALPLMDPTRRRQERLDLFRAA